MAQARRGERLCNAVLARLSSAPAPLIAASIATLPFVRGLALQRAFYFRDLARYFIPMRLFFNEGLRSGELRLWNPWSHEGAAELPLLFYPPDLLSLPFHGAAAISLVLALHVGLAAAAMTALVRSLGGGRIAAIAGGTLYALSGYGLSLLNLDIALKAYAWAPLLALTLRRAVAGGRVETGLAAATFGVALTALSPEILLQAILLAALLSFPPLGARRLRNVVVALALACGVAAAPLLLQASLIPGTARGGLLSAEDSMTDAIPAAGWLQVVVVNLLGDMSDPGTRWWGYAHYRRGFPYIVSLYMGPTALALAAIGLFRTPWLRRRLLAVLVLALLALGVAGWTAVAQGLLEMFPLLRTFRYPVKLFFLVQFAIAVLTAGGAHALARDRTAWVGFCIPAAALGAGLSVGRLVWWLRPELLARWMSGLFPPSMPLAQSLELVDFVSADAAAGGALALAAALMGLLVMTGRLRPAPSAALVVAVMVTDLIRAGAGLNPMVRSDFYTPSEAGRGFFDRVTAEDGRVFTCDLFQQRGYVSARALAGERGATFAFAAMVESAFPDTNVPLAIPTALSQDLVGLLPVGRSIDVEEASCESIADLLARLRLAGVTHVVSADPLTTRALTLDTILRPPRLAPLALFAYRLDGPRPRYSVAARALPAAGREAAEAAALADDDPGTVRVEGLSAPREGARGTVERVSRRTRWFRIEASTDTPSLLIVREGFDAAWRAEVDGVEVPVYRADGRHMAIPIDAGDSVVVLRHRPLMLLPGLVISVASTLAAAALILAPRGRRSGGAGHLVDGPIPDPAGGTTRSG